MGRKFTPLERVATRNTLLRLNVLKTLAVNLFSMLASGSAKALLFTEAGIDKSAHGLRKADQDHMAKESAMKRAHNNPIPLQKSPIPYAKKTNGTSNA